MIVMLHAVPHQTSCSVNHGARRLLAEETESTAADRQKLGMNRTDGMCSGASRQRAHVVQQWGEAKGGAACRQKRVGRRLEEEQGQAASEAAGRLGHSSMAKATQARDSRGNGGGGDQLGGDVSGRRLGTRLRDGGLRRSHSCFSKSVTAWQLSGSLGRRRLGEAPS